MIGSYDLTARNSCHATAVCWHAALLQGLGSAQWGALMIADEMPLSCARTRYQGRTLA